ncbi:hypothetical protein SAMN05428952_10306 [Nitrosomonas sp. Nm132]|jgi:putative SOS response-associated peptidase YedK|nr:hypothetical protein SAMN05428952_10306 [Nitrosomonas sp. Nm132]
MCESFCLAYPRSGLINLSHVATMPEIEPRYNLTPSTDILVIRDRVNSQARSMMLPGLISHGISKSLAIKPMFKHAFCCQRCLILPLVSMNGNFWQEVKPNNHFMSLPSGSAVLWSFCSNQAQICCTSCLSLFSFLASR